MLQWTDSVDGHCGTCHVTERGRRQSRADANSRALARDCAHALVIDCEACRIMSGAFPLNVSSGLWNTVNRFVWTRWNTLTMDTMYVHTVQLRHRRRRRPSTTRSHTCTQPQNITTASPHNAAHIARLLCRHSHRRRPIRADVLLVPTVHSHRLRLPLLLDRSICDVDRAIYCITPSTG